MADKIQIRAGNKSGMPTLTDRELAYVKDETALYIGTAGGNKRLTHAPVEAQEALDEGSDLQAVIEAYNNLIAAMKSSGVMNT